MRAIENIQLSSRQPQNSDTLSRIHSDPSPLPSTSPNPEPSSPHTTTAPAMFYGRRDLINLASNNPHAHSGYIRCYAPEKHISAMSPTDVTLLQDVYERRGGIHKITLDILQEQGLLGSNGDGSRDAIVMSFGPVRMGFFDEVGSPEDQLALLIVLQPGHVSTVVAEAIVLEITSRAHRIMGLTLATNENNGIPLDGNTRLYIDICESHPNLTDARSEKFGYSSMSIYRRVYDETFPTINSSIGMKGKEPTGTLCCYFQREGSQEVYGITNCHVVFGTATSCPPYRHQNGEERKIIVSPSFKDHETAIKALKFKLETHKAANQEALRKLKELKQRSLSYENEIPKYVNSELKSLEALVTDQQIHMTTTEATLAKVNGFNCELGYVLGASGLSKQETVHQSILGNQEIDTSDRSGKGDLENELKGRQDWAIFLITRENQASKYNSHRLVTESRHLQTSLEFLELMEEAEIDLGWVEETENHFISEIPPCLTSMSSGALKDNEPFIKPPSARTSFRLGKYNGIRRTLCDEDCGITREHTVAVIRTSWSISSFSVGGDSGSAVLDKERRLLGMLWGGGPSTSKAAYAVEDLTYVTLMDDIIPVIEDFFKWEKGSCYVVNTR